MRLVPVAFLVLLSLGVASQAPGQADNRTERVRFDPGASSAVVEASITGDETVDYVLDAGAGQYMNVSMATDNGANVFNILAPGEDSVTLFDASTASGRNQYEGITPAAGDYTVRVYLMPSAARRDEVANYRLEMIIAQLEQPAHPGEPAGRGEAGVPAAPEAGGPRHWEVTGVGNGLNLREQPSTSAAVIGSYARGTVLANLGCQRGEGRVWCDVQELRGGARGYVAAEFLTPVVSPDGSVAMGPDDSALRAGQGDFDATGQIPCAQSSGQPMGRCDFGVARAGGGAATVVVARPDGTTRAIFFGNGVAMGADTGEADASGAFSAERDGDLNLIRIGEERYEIPDAVVLGG